MIIRTPALDLDRTKELKVKVSAGQLIRLHSIKVLTGKPISDVVREALERYFEQERRETGPTDGAFAGN